MRAENEALHCEVADLTKEITRQRARLEAENKHLRACACELEQQLQSVAMGYEQVDRQYQVLAKENLELRASLSIATAARASSHDTGSAGLQATLQKEVIDS